MAKNILSEDIEYNYVEKVPKIDPGEFQKVVESRRSVRIFDGKPIPDKIMNICLENALLAPNSSNLQPWGFYLVQNPGRKKALIRACLDQTPAKTAAEIVVVIARTSTWREHAAEMLGLFSRASDIPPLAKKYYKRIVPFVYNMGPLGIFGIIKRIMFFFMGFKTPIIREPVTRSHLKLWAVKTAALGAQNLMLSLRAYGYDSCPMEGYDSKRIKKILRLPSDAVVVMVVAAGKRGKGGVYGERIRFDSERFIKKV